MEFENSNEFTRSLQHDIMKMPPPNEEGRTRQQIKNTRRRRNNVKLEELRSNMSDANKRLNDFNKEVGSSNWLTSLPMKEQGYALNKEQFWDALRIRYDWFIPRLPTECVCGAKFNVSHALSCKKGGFITMRHNEVRDITGRLMEEVCRDVRKEPVLMELHNEPLTTASRKQKTRCTS